MKSLTRFLTGFACSLILCQCESKKQHAALDDPELAFCVMLLKIVDSLTGEPISDFIGINFKDSGVETFSSPHPLSRTLSVRVAEDEGLIFTSWVAPIHGLGGLEIEVDGYESLVVNPLAEEIHKGFSHSFSKEASLGTLQRTVRMKPIGQD